MNLTKARIIESISKKNDYSKIKFTNIVESVLEIVKKTLASGEYVLLSVFGKFCVNEKRERKGRNSETENSRILKARRIVTFRCSSNFKARMNRKI